MLAGVLLHVVKPAFPINPAMDGFPFVRGRPSYLAIYNMHHGPVTLSLEDIADGDIVEGALVVGLSAGGGIETGPVQNQSQPIAHSDPFKHLGLELLLIGIIVVQPLGHLSFIAPLRSGYLKKPVWWSQAIHIVDVGSR
jgi:hypothetical protein